MRRPFRQPPRETVDQAAYRVFGETTDAVEILHRRYGNPSPEVRARIAAEDKAEMEEFLKQPGVCRRCGGSFPDGCSCPDDSHWNKRSPGGECSQWPWVVKA
jgi:hypothetical protein